MALSLTMISSETFRKACTFTLKGFAWLLYAGFIEYCVSRTAYYFFNPPEDDVNDTVFFTEENSNCWPHIVGRMSCGEDCSYSKLRKILHYMDTARSTLDVCVYQLTSIEMSWSILECHKRGVKVRVITDGWRVTGSGSQIHTLQEKGVPVCTVEIGGEMHHKFFIADKKTLVNCSCNWTMQGLAGNSEDTVICNSPIIIKNFLMHFEALWETHSVNAHSTNNMKVSEK